MKPGKPNGTLSRKIEIEQSRRARCDYDGDPPACRNCRHVAMPTPGGKYSYPWCRKHGFSVRLYANCETWAGVDGTKLEGSA